MTTLPTVSYASLIYQISGYLGENKGMSAEDAGLSNRLINAFLRLAWRYYWFPDCMADIQPCQFRASYDPTAAYLPIVEVYYPPTMTYYQAVQPTQGNLPVLADGCSVNAAFWARSQSGYGGDWWTPNTAYNVGDQVRNPADSLFYQCFAAQMSGSTLDFTAFGVLTPFIRSLDFTLPDGTPIGEVKKIWNRDPEAHPAAEAIEFWRKPRYILVRGREPVVYPEVRMRPPVLSGVNYDPAFGGVPGQTSYSDGQTVYYVGANPGATGNYFTAIAGPQTDTPPNTNWWRLEPVPYIFAEYLAQSVYAALVAKEEQVPEDFALEQTAGFPLLQQEVLLLERYQNQVPQLNVVGGSRGNGGRWGYRW